MTAHRIEQPNFTQIPNVIFDYWMQELTPAEFKVLMCICRKTFGWKKSKDRISLRQIEIMTKLSRPSIIKNIERLIELGLVVKIKSKDEFDGSDAPNQFEVYVYECEEESEKNIGGSKLSLPPPVNSVYPPLVNSVYPQNKDITKERPTKENTQGGGDIFSSSQKKSEPAKKPASSEKIQVLENVQLTQEQLDKLKAEFGNDEALAMCRTLSNYKHASGKNYKSDYHALIGWVKERHADNKAKKITPLKGKMSLPTDGQIDPPDAEWRKKKL